MGGRLTKSVVYVYFDGIIGVIRGGGGGNWMEKMGLRHLYIAPYNFKSEFNAN